MVVTKLKLAEFIPDPQQKLALEHVTGPMLVIAGAGTGKTSVLTQRFARLVDQGHAKAEEILALTYTLNSAAEMKKRVQLASAAARNAQAYTFHDYCFDMLKRHGHGFDVIDDCDLNILLRKRIRDLNLKYFVRAAKVGQFLKDLLEFMRRCQDELVTSSQYRAYIGQLERGEAAIHRIAKSRDVEDILPEDALGRCQEIAGVFEVVEKWLADEKIGTF
jgi:superfamily I DNA/RNA helicase